MWNGTFEDKGLNEAMNYSDLLAENGKNQDIMGTCEEPTKAQLSTSSGRIYNLREDHEL